MYVCFPVCDSSQTQGSLNVTAGTVGLFSRGFRMVINSSRSMSVYIQYLYLYSDVRTILTISASYERILQHITVGYLRLYYYSEYAN